MATARSARSTFTSTEGDRQAGEPLPPVTGAAVTDQAQEEQAKGDGSASLRGAALMPAGGAGSRGDGPGQAGDGLAAIAGGPAAGRASLGATAPRASRARGSIAITVDHVSKCFHMNMMKHGSLKGKLVRRDTSHSLEVLWALDDVSMEVHEGETVGLMGQNGSGKSTLLKCVAGILQPTSGCAARSGQCWSLGQVSSQIYLGETMYS